MQAPKKYTNRLIDETSPYLLQHAHNPVDWYPWGEEAFAKAKVEDKPVLVSIGYSACHWCHVMEHESFEDEETARVMNENFVNIKVDMEERPDVDKIYMNFVQLTTGRGGWPMNVFLTPDKLPFFGGTYFPPVSRYNMPAFKNVLMSVAEAYRDKRDELLRSATDILGELRRVGLGEASPTGLTLDALDTAFQSFVRSFDSVNGGFGGAPKFPPAMSLEFLLRYYKRTGNENALEMVAKTAKKMANGGIYDQLGGGFHRYSVDAVWLVPHFEKMLYDNAQLIRIYLHLYQIFRDRSSVSTSSGANLQPPSAAGGTDNDAEFYKRIAVETLDYVAREMTNERGGFYSTQDADSEGVEGKFFVWTPDEVEAILGVEDGREFCEYYDVTANGNFEGKNILNVRNDTDRNASLNKRAQGRNASVNERASSQVLATVGTLPDGRVSARIEQGRKKLFAEREKRIKPFRDEKILTAWNGLMLAAFAEAAAVLGRQDYLDVAMRNADFLLRNLVEKAENESSSSEQERTTPASQGLGHPSFVRRGALLRTYKDGKAKLNAYLEDYANFADGLIELYQVSGKTEYLDEAKRLADILITEFWDEENGGFFFTANDHEELLVRSKDYFDNATPSGNSVAADVLLKLAKLLGDEKYERFAVTVLRLAASQLNRYPGGFGRTLSVLEFCLGPAKEIVVIGERGNELEREIASTYLPHCVRVFTKDPEADAGFVPLLEGRKMIDGRATAYVCEDFVCQRPVTLVEDLREQLG